MHEIQILYLLRDQKATVKPCSHFEGFTKQSVVASIRLMKHLDVGWCMVSPASVAEALVPQLIKLYMFESPKIFVPKLKAWSAVCKTNIYFIFYTLYFIFYILYFIFYIYPFPNESHLQRSKAATETY